MSEEIQTSIAELLARARSGDPDAFSSYVSLVNSEFFQIAFRILRDVHLAEDALQVAYRNIWTGLATTFDPLRDGRAWGRMIVRNAAISEYRKRKRRELPLGGDLACPASESETDRSWLQETLDRLPPALREVLIRRLVGHSNGTVASDLNIPYGTVASRLNRAKRLLAEMWNAAA